MRLKHWNGVWIWVWIWWRFKPGRFSSIMNIHTWFSLLWSKYVLMTKSILIKTGLQNLKRYPGQWKPRRNTEIGTGDWASWATAVATRPGPDQRFSMASWFSCYGWVYTGYGSRVWIYRYGGMDFNKKTQLPSFGGMDLGYGFMLTLYGFQKKISEIDVNQWRADRFAHSCITCKTNPAICIYE